MPVITQKQWEIKMSDKKWYKLVFKQLQPLHIGAGSYGVISETRIFIPGWTMWGALTKAYNIQCNDGKLSENQELFEEISCFYPCFDGKGDNPLLPAYKNGEFYLGDYSESEFRAKFVDTFISTAVLPGSRMAKDESLHEINIILPGAKSEFLENENEKQLYWVGMLKIEEDKKSEFLRENELEITVGGDSRYGFGRLKLVMIDEIDKDNNSDDFDKLFKANYVVIKNPDERKLLSGDVEFIIEIKGYNGNRIEIEKTRYCYTPGSELSDTITKNIKLSRGCLSKKNLLYKP